MNRLVNLDIKEVSLVSRPANKRKFLIMKGEDGMNELIESILKMDIKDEAKIDEVLKQNKLSDKAIEAVKGALKLLVAFKDELPKNILETLAELTGYGYPVPDTKTAKADGCKEPTKKDDGSLDLSKVPDELKGTIETIWKEHQDAVKKAEELEKALKVEKEAQMKKEFIEKAEKTLSHIPMKSDELGAMLKDIAVTIPETYHKLETVLKSVDELIAKSEMFKELGNSGSGTTSVMARITAMANEVKKSVTGMTIEQAVAKVLNDNKNLYDEYMKEVGGVR